MTNKIKVYNLKEKIEKEDFDGKKLTTFDFNKIGIIEGTKGVLAFDDEGVGYLKNNIDEDIEIGLNEIPKENIIYAMPKYTAKMTLKQIISESSYEEMELTQFIERYNYNNRLKNNFSIVLKTIKEIGLKSKDYYEDRE